MSAYSSRRHPYRAQQRLLSSDLKTALLLGSLAALIAAEGYLLFGAFGSVMALAVTVMLMVLSARGSMGFALGFQGGLPLDVSTAPALASMVQRLAGRAGIRAPRLYLIPSQEPNAITAGTGDGGVVGITEGALRLLDHEEIEAVLAHEIGHLRNRDTAILQMADTLSRATIELLRVGLWLVLVTVMMTLDWSKVWQLAALSVLVPAVVTTLVPALSRAREYAADEAAVELTGRPLALASALRKLERSHQSWIGALFGLPGVPPRLRSHPPTDLRVERLVSMAESRGVSRPPARSGLHRHLTAPPSPFRGVSAPRPRPLVVFRLAGFDHQGRQGF